MLDTAVISGEDICCSVVFGSLVGVSVFSVMWSELLKTSDISCPLWSSVYECQRVECVFTSLVNTECGMFVMCCTQCCMSVSTVVHGCVVSRRYIHVCNSDSVLYPDHMKLCVACIDGRRYVMLSLTSEIIPPPALCNIRHARW